MDDNPPLPIVQQKPDDSENFLDVAGCRVIRDPWALPGWTAVRNKEEYDKDMLEKLWSTGLDVATLDEAHFKYHISPIRDVKDYYTTLGKERNTYGKHGAGGLYKEHHLTALALQYPDLQKPGEVLPYKYFIRMRPREVIVTSKGEKMKYQQPNTEDSGSNCELYFLIKPNMWEKIYDSSLPLIIGEGEFKGVSLALAEFAAIAIPSCTMWRAKDKKDIIHWSLDPKNPWGIPIVGRTVILIPDVDFHTKPGVSSEFRKFARKLHLAGATVKISLMPYPRRNEWKGIDDYLVYHSCPRWAGEPSKVERNHQLVLDIIEGGECEDIREDSHYKPIDTLRSRNRILDQLSKQSRYTLVGTADCQEISWFIYDIGDTRYRREDVCFTLNGTSGKMAKPSAGLRKLIEDDYEMAIKLYDGEGFPPPKDGFKSMSIDYPNAVLAKVDTLLPRIPNDSLIEPFDGVAEGDTCLRISNALINMTKAFQLKLDWNKRGEWLLPPNHRWFSISGLNISLSNLNTEPTCPLFLEFLNNAFEGDVEKLQCLQLWFGKFVTSPYLYDLQQFLCLYGKAGSGKSTLVRILAAIIGESEIETVRAIIGGRFELAGAVGKKLLLFNEAMDGLDRSLNQSLVTAIKEITGGDKTTIERKFQNKLSVRVKTEVLLVSNVPPTMHMDEEAFKRRVVFLSTTQKIDNPSSAKEAEMRQELPGIFLWALRGAMYLKDHPEHKIETPTDCLQDLEDAIEDVSPEAAFIRQRVIKTEKPNAVLTRNKLEEAFLEWLRETNRTGYRYQVKILSRLVGEIHSVKSETVRNPEDTKQMTKGFRGLTISGVGYMT